VTHLVRVVALLGIVAMPLAAYAQPSVGVRVGFNLATLTSDPPPLAPLELKTRSGLVAGGFVTLPINNALAFQPEALYSRQGTKYTYSSATGGTELNYIQVPLLARVRTGVRSPLAVLVGPSLGVRIEGPERISPAFIAGPDEVFRRFDLGLATGAVLDVGHVVFDGRYTWGLTNVLKDSIGGEPTTDKQKNRVFALSAGLRF
jgi:Outer membrane protein beta-barrel domain